MNILLLLQSMNERTCTCRGETGRNMVILFVETMKLRPLYLEKLPIGFVEPPSKDSAVPSLDWVTFIIMGVGYRKIMNRQSIGTVKPPLKNVLA